MATAELALDFPAVAPAVDAPTATAAQTRAHAIECYFGGHTAMYDSIRAASLLQFRIDIDTGDAACVSLNRTDLHRLAHSLKGVLLLLGESAASGQARALEVAAAAAAGDVGIGAGVDSHASLALWHELRAAVLDLR